MCWDKNQSSEPVVHESHSFSGILGSFLQYRGPEKRILLLIGRQVVHSG